jgi:WD40 repeat protein
MWDLNSNQITQFAKHDDAIRHIVALPNVCLCLSLSLCYPDTLLLAVLQVIATGSWDRTIRYWDVRTPSATPQQSVSVSDRVAVMDVMGNLAVIGTANRRMVLYDLRNPSVEFKTFEAPLKYQLRSVAIFPDISGFALGSIEGRISIQYVESQDKNFVFKWYASPSIPSARCCLAAYNLVNTATAPYCCYCCC